MIDKLRVLKDERIVLVRDQLRLLSEVDGGIHRFANDNGYTVIIASTNLVFRELFERVSHSKDAGKLLLIDRAPARRRAHISQTKAPPPFYPDILSKAPQAARIDVSLRQFLIEKTGDSGWPQEANDPRFARLMSGCLENILKAHRNLRVADASRFTDHDFKTIVAYAALGVPEAAFKRPESKIYWRIGLIGYPMLEEINSLAPEIASSIHDELRNAPPPFCWFAEHPPELVVRSFYLSTILAQHINHWNLLLANIDPDLKPFSGINTDLIQSSAPELVSLDPMRAHEDILEIETSLPGEVLNFILIDQMKMQENSRFADVIEKEHYSVLIRSLALLLALDNLLSAAPQLAAHERVSNLLSAQDGAKGDVFIEQRPSTTWENLKVAYGLARAIRDIHEALSLAVKNLRVRQTADLSFEWFRSLWNEKRVGRLEYYLSALERLVFSADFLPHPSCNIPPAFQNASHRIRERMGTLRSEIQGLIDDLNRRFQDLVAAQYNSWSKGDSEILLTSQFLKRCVKPNWDPKTEKAVVLVFDGMRYDIWDELVRPNFEDRMEIIADYPATSLLPSETQISRKAIFAGSFADSFDTRSSEDALLKGALKQQIDYEADTEVVAPEGAGTGETVRYRAGSIDFYIFELCDKELHKVPVKTLPDGRCVPGRPLVFIYQQHIKDIIDTEVMAIIRNLQPDTKVFVVADHGFGPIGRDRVRVETPWLNELADCRYQNAWLRQTLEDMGASRKVRSSVLEFRVSELHMPHVGEAFDRSENRNWQKTFASIIFPRTGYALARPNTPFHPDAYSHGGISIQEMLVPMIAMRVRSLEEGILKLDVISGPTEIIEGEEAEFRLPLRLSKSHKDIEVRIEATASYGHKDATCPLPRQVQYVSKPGGEVVFRFVPDDNDASMEERKAGVMKRVLKIDITYNEAQRFVRKTRALEFSLRLNPERIVRRVPTHLGKILGLTPRSMK